MLYDQSCDLLEIRGATAAGPGYLKLTTGEATVVACDVFGKIEFQAPAECGTDAIVAGANIQAVAQDTFSATVNNTDLLFMTGLSGAATEKFRFTANGELGVGGANYGTDGQVLTSTGAGTAPAWEDAAGGPTEAVQADMEDEGTSNANRYISPEVAKYHPGVAVAWCQIEADGTLNTTLDYNVATVDDTGTGNRRVNLTNALSHVNSFVGVFGTDIAGGGARLSRVDTDSIDCLIYNSSDALADGGGFDHFAAFGDFA